MIQLYMIELFFFNSKPSSSAPMKNPCAVFRKRYPAAVNIRNIDLADIPTLANDDVKHG
jgi:hypothetical protein